MCGYSSHASFIKAFKEKFSLTPSAWKNGGYKSYAQDILQKSTSAINSNADFTHLSPSIVKMKEIEVHYVRHQGYDKSIRESWQKLQTWTLCNDMENATQIGLHHDNPTITPLNECNYIACISLEKEIKNSTLPTLQIPAGVYARFSFSGKYGDVLKFMNWVYFEWLVSSGYETTTNPAFAIYHKNHFLAEDGVFNLSYHIPIRF